MFKPVLSVARAVLKSGADILLNRNVQLPPPQEWGVQPYPGQQHHGAPMQGLADLHRRPAPHHPRNQQQPRPHHPHQNHHGFAQPVAINPRLPVGATSFVQHQMISEHLHTRHGGELQTLRLRHVPLGVMTRYPFKPREVAAMLERALHSASPRITDLKNFGDGGIHHSYVDLMPEGRVCRIGHLHVIKQTIGQSDIGSNGHHGRIRHIHTQLHVQDPSKPNQPWRKVSHHAFPGWLDGSAIPRNTFERLWKLLYKTGRTDWGVVHCLGGVGRTPTLMWRLSFQAYLEKANREGRRVGPAETANFLDQLTQEARHMRGGQVLPDADQYRMLYESCLHALQFQR